MKRFVTIEEAGELALHDLEDAFPPKDSTKRKEQQNMLEKSKAVDLARDMNALRAMHERVSKLASSINELYDSVRFSHLPRAMEAEDLESFKVPDVGRVALTPDVRVSIPAANKQSAYEWLDQQGSGDLIQETVNSGTLAAFVRKRLRDGKPVPEELFKVTPFTRATITKA